MHPALEVRKSALQYGRALRGAIKARARGFGMLMRFRRPRVIFGNGLLIAAQHIHSEPLTRMQMSMRPRPLVHANQDQHRVEGDGGESVRRHAVDLAVLIDGNHRDPGCETSHGPAEIASGKAHSEPAGHQLEVWSGQPESFSCKCSRTESLPLESRERTHSTPSAIEHATTVRTVCHAGTRIHCVRYDLASIFASIIVACVGVG